MSKVYFSLALIWGIVKCAGGMMAALNHGALFVLWLEHIRMLLSRLTLIVINNTIHILYY